MNIAIVLSSMGGIVSFITCCFFVVKAILRLVTATHDNTDAMQEIQKTIINLGDVVSKHTIDIAILTDRFKRS